MDIITHEDFIQVLLEIDASAYFQIITIVFNNPSKQYDFLQRGRVPKTNLMTVKKPMSHVEIVNRISEYCLKYYEEGDPIRL